MPKPTFFNLPAGKRNSFVKIAMQEFADREYHSASVSKIVEHAGIAKGSVYQYFRDKQDLFLYLLDAAQGELIAFIQRSAPPQKKEDFFAALRRQMSATVEASHKYPVHAKLVMRAYSSPLPFRDKVLEGARTLRQDYYRTMITQAQSSGQLNPGLDPALAGLLIQGVMNEIGPFLQAKFGRRNNWGDLPEVEDVFDQAIGLLKRGLGTRRR
jgi:AcrR family transcriptional regulator